jgi:hypothetical protein
MMIVHVLKGEEMLTDEEIASGRSRLLNSRSNGGLVSVSLCRIHMPEFTSSS